MSAFKVRLLVKLHVDVPPPGGSDAWGEVGIRLYRNVGWLGPVPVVGHHLRLIEGTGQIAKISAMIWERDGAGLTIVMDCHGDISEQLLEAGWHLDQP